MLVFFLLLRLQKAERHNFRVMSIPVVVMTKDSRMITNFKVHAIKGRTSLCFLNSQSYRSYNSHIFCVKD